MRPRRSLRGLQQQRRLARVLAHKPCTYISCRLLGRTPACSAPWEYPQMFSSQQCKPSASKLPGASCDPLLRQAGSWFWGSGSEPAAAAAASATAEWASSGSPGGGGGMGVCLQANASVLPPPGRWGGLALGVASASSNSSRSAACRPCIGWRTVVLAGRVCTSGHSNSSRSRRAGHAWP
jgi:hypothetical protein